MCIGGTPDVPKVPERQPAQEPKLNLRDRLSDRDRRRRGYLATMFAPAAGAAATTNITGV